MTLGQLLREIKCLPKDLELYIHEIGKDGLVSFKPLKGINWGVSDRKLSFGTKDFNEVEFELSKSKGLFLGKKVSKQ